MAPVVVLAIIVLAVPIAYVAVRDARRLRRTHSLVARGAYAEAREIHERIARSWMSLLPGVADASRYGIALSRHMEGDFEQALVALASIDRGRADRHLVSAVASLEATSLVLAERDPMRAIGLLEEVAPIERPPEDLVSLAHARFGIGDVAAAERLLAMAGAERAEGTPHHRAIFHTMRGLLLMKLGRSADAVADFERAAAIPLQNWYTSRARALLPPAAGAELDPRSSLAPIEVNGA